MDNPPAFPCQPSFDPTTWPPYQASSGMSLRDYFAAHALAALGDHDAVKTRGIPWLVDHAYMVADAMLEKRKA